jgi:methionyl-tRNA formyltransferase
MVPLQLVFMGTPPFAAVCLERLLRGPHDVRAVVTRADRPRGRGQELQPSAVKALAVEHGLEVLQPRTAKDETFQARLRELAPDVAVVVAYGRILPSAVIEIPRLGCINAHASLLPRLRGAAPIERAILEGERETGVTIMRIDERMDAGDVIAMRRVPIGATTDAASLRETLAELSADLLAEVLDQLAAGTARFTPQDEGAATYAPPLDKREAAIDWNASAESVERQVRAFRPSPGAFTFDGKRRLKILSATVVDDRPDAEAGTLLAGNDAMLVACGRGSLRIDMVQPEGKRPMSGADYLRGAAAPRPRRLT